MNEDSELGVNGCVPCKEVLQVGRVKAFASVSGTNKDVGISGYGEPPIHPVGIGESKDCMPFE